MTGVLVAVAIAGGGAACGSVPSFADLQATGGGVSAHYAGPGYQHGLPLIGDHRGVPDVAADGAYASSLALLQVAPDGHEVTSPGGGERIGAAVGGDRRARRPGRSPSAWFSRPGLYRLGHSTLYHRAFHDVTHGNNTVTRPLGKQISGYSARVGWDPVTGWGSPDAQVLVPLLGKEVRSDDGGGL